MAAELLQAFLVTYSEPLLFVHHRQAQVLELYVFLQQPVGPDHDVDAAALQALDDFLLLFGSPEAAEHLHPHREGAEPFAEGRVMLLGQHGGGHQQADLHAFVYRLEGGAQRNLRLAVTHVTADQAVHGPGLLHVGLDFVDRLGLVWSLDERERVFQLLLPYRVGAEIVSLRHLPGGIYPDQLLGHLPGGPLDPLLDAGPFGGAEAGEVGGVVLGPHVGGDPVQVVGGNVELVAVGVLQYQVFPVFAAVVYVGGAGEPGHPMVDVDYEGPGDQVGKSDFRPVFRAAGSVTAAFFNRAEQLGVGQQLDPGHPGAVVGTGQLHYPTVPQ